MKDLLDSSSDEEIDFLPSSSSSLVSLDDINSDSTKEVGIDYFQNNEFVLAKQKNILQLQVLDQTLSVFGLSDRSCGYHALKNGIFVSKLLLTANPSANYLRKIQDPQSKYLDKQSIKIARLKKKTSELLLSALLEQLRRTAQSTANTKQLWFWNKVAPFLAQDQLQRDLYRNCLVAVANSLVANMSLTIFSLALTHPQHTIISLADIILTIQQELRRQIATNPTNLNTLEIIYNEDVIKKYFSELLAIDLTISDELIEERSSNQKMTIQSTVDVDFEQYRAGNWLTREEIQSLLVLYEQDINPQASFIVLGDTGNNTPISEQLELEHEGIQAKLLETSKPIKVLIIFDNNHWITCVIDERSTEKKYYLTNSFNNQIIIGSDSIRQIKNIVERKPVELHSYYSDSSQELTIDTKIGKQLV